MNNDVNIPLLRKAVEWVEEQDALPIETRSWMQREIILPEAHRIHSHGHQPGCGTAFCIAGYVADQVRPGIGWEEAIPVAEQALGLPRGHNLFMMTNSAKTIREVAERIAGERL